MTKYVTAAMLHPKYADIREAFLSSKLTIHKRGDYYMVSCGSLECGICPLDSSGLCAGYNEPPDLILAEFREYTPKTHPELFI